MVLKYYNNHNQRRNNKGLYNSISFILLLLLLLNSPITSAGIGSVTGPNCPLLSLDSAVQQKVTGAIIIANTSDPSLPPKIPPNKYNFPIYYVMNTANGQDIKNFLMDNIYLKNVTDPNGDRELLKYR